MAKSAKNKNRGKEYGSSGGSKNPSRGNALHGGRNHPSAGENKAGSGAPDFRGADFAVEESAVPPLSDTGDQNSSVAQTPARAEKNAGDVTQVPARAGKTTGGVTQSPARAGKTAGGAAQTSAPHRGDGDQTAAAVQAAVRLGNNKGGAAQTSAPLPGKAAGGAYTLAVFLMMLVSFLLALAATVISGGDRQAYQDIVSKNAFRLLSYALPQVAFCLTVYAVLRFAKIKIGQAFPCKKPPVYLWAAAILLAFGLLFGLGNVNELFLSFLKKFGYETPQNALPAMRNAGEYLLTVFCVAVLPAVMEEALFRGVVLGGLRGRSTLFAVLISGLYFSLFHQNPAQTPYQFLAGAAFAFAAIASGNVFITVAAHFCNNLYILSATYFGFSVSAHRGWTVLGLLALAISLGLFFLAGKKRGAFRPEGNASAAGKISANKTSSATAAKQEPRPEIKDFFVYSLPGVIASVIAWVLVLVS